MNAVQPCSPYNSSLFRALRELNGELNSWCLAENESKSARSLQVSPRVREEMISSVRGTVTVAANYGVCELVFKNS